MKTMPSVGFALFISVFFAVGFGVLGYGIRSLLMSNRARTWPTTQGTVESCEMEESSDSDGSTWEAKVKYSYSVGGARYEGERIAFGYSASSGRDAHQEIFDKLSGAESVLVRYDPVDPSDAVLSYGLNRGTVFLLVFGATWLLFVTGFTVLFATSSMSDAGILNTLVTTR